MDLNEIQTAAEPFFVSVDRRRACIPKIGAQQHLPSGSGTGAFRAGKQRGGQKPLENTASGQRQHDG
jgi:hypothetical protein